MRRYAKRIVVQTAGFLILYALIFVAAGTIHFWQGWLFCISFTLGTIVIGIYLLNFDPALLERRMRFGPVEESRPIERVVLIIILIAFIALMIVAGLDHRFGWSIVPASIVILANLMVFASFVLLIPVMRANTFAAATITVEEGQRVISTGPYAYVRHPMYTSNLLLIVSMPIALGSWWGLVPLAIAMPALIVRILDEERALSADLPGYTDYSRAVPYRLLPHVW